MMKRIFFIVGLLAFSYTIVAQDNAKGIEYYEAGLYDFAKTYFEQQKNTNTNIQAEKYYYLGLVSIAENTDSADFYFEKAICAVQDHQDLGEQVGKELDITPLYKPHKTVMFKNIFNYDS